MPTMIPSEDAFQFHFDKGCTEYEGGNLSAAAIHLTHARRQLVPIIQHGSDPERRTRYEALLGSIDRALDTCANSKGLEARRGSTSSETTLKRKDAQVSEERQSATKPPAGIQLSRAEALKEAQAELNAMIGLKSLREMLAEIGGETGLLMKRREKGIEGKIGTSLHILLTGNPGTGKTTVAGLLGKLLYGAGYLEKGHIVQTSMEKLKAGYVGQSEALMDKAIDDAIGGVLFIDEAYALAEGGETDFGVHICNVLNRRMEAERENLVVVAAGYKDKMGDFLNMNSGFPRKFTEPVDLPDYTPSELTAIALKMVGDGAFEAPGELYMRIHVLCSLLSCKDDPNRGNAGFIREQVFGRCVRRMGLRVQPQIEGTADVDVQTLKALVPDDLPFKQLCGIPWSHVDPDQLQWELKRENGDVIQMDADTVGQYFANMTDHRVLDEGQPELTPASKQYLAELVGTVN